MKVILASLTPLSISTSIIFTPTPNEPDLLPSHSLPHSHSWVCWKVSHNQENCFQPTFTHDQQAQTQHWPAKKLRVIQSSPTPCNPMDYSPPGSSAHGILQARILEWIAIPFSRGSSQPRDRTQISQADSLPPEPPGKPRILEWAAYPPPIFLVFYMGRKREATWQELPHFNLPKYLIWGLFLLPCFNHEMFLLLTTVSLSILYI